MANREYEITHRHIESILPRIQHPAEGLIPYPYLTPTYGEHYAGIVYCWDTHHMTLRFAAAGDLAPMRHFVGNMLHHQTVSGFVPSIISKTDGGSLTSKNFHAQPFLAQNVAIYLNKSGDREWVRSIYGKLKAYLEYWLDRYRAPLGLYRWWEVYMSGIDNDIMATILPPGTVILPDLNAWLYLELTSMAFIEEQLGEKEAAVRSRREAEALKQAINDHLWDEELGTYAGYDLSTGACRVSWRTALECPRGETLNESVGRYAFLSCSSLLPLYAGIASPERARRMIVNYVLDPAHFRSPFGIRSLSASSEFYNMARWGNPPRFGDHRRLTNSNWQGPIWIPITWFAFHALLRYGFREEAASLADDTCRLIAMNVEKLGFMRENFHAETGEGLYADYFASWNILADLFPDYLREGEPSLRLFFDQ